MRRGKNLSHNRLLECVDYNPDTGIFIAKKTVKGSKYRPGDILGSAISSGYIQIYVDGVSYLAHRLAWFYMTGDWPENDIDHKDRVKTHNWFLNLRKSTRRQNIHHQPVKATSSTGVKGVYFHKGRGVYHARIRVNGKRKHLGSFATPEEAKSAYDAAAMPLHGDFYVR